MIEGEEGKTTGIARRTEDGSLDPGAPWTPAADGNQELTIGFTSPSEITAVQMTDQNDDVNFQVSYKPEGSDDFIFFEKANGEPMTLQMT